MSDEDFSKENLLARILGARVAFESVLARIPEEKMQETILHDEWSVKDLLGHIAFWEEIATSHFEALRAGQTPNPITDMDALNARILNDFRHLSLEEVWDREMVAYQNVLDMIENASEDELFKPDHFPWTNGNPFETWIASNTWEHYAEHLPELQTWLEANPAVE